MTRCNAKVTTATETDEVVWSGAANQPWTHVVPDGEAVVRRGDRLLRLDLHTLTCVSYHVNGEHLHVTHEGEAWTDDTHGATPHTPPLHEQIFGESSKHNDYAAALCPTCGENNWHNAWRCKTCDPVPEIDGPPADEQECGTCAATGCRYPESHDPPCECCDECDNGYITPPADEGYQPGHGPHCCTPKPPADVCFDCAGTGAQHYNGNGDCPSCGGTGTPPADVCPDCRDYDHRGTCLGERCACDRYPSCGGTGKRPAMTPEQFAERQRNPNRHPLTCGNRTPETHPREDDYNDRGVLRLAGDGVTMYCAFCDYTQPLPGTGDRPTVTDATVKFNDADSSLTVPTVTDAEVDVALAVLVAARPWDEANSDDVRAALEAAAAARQEGR